MKMKDHTDEQPAIFLLDINVHQLLYIGESPFKIWENRVTTAGGKKRVEINYFNYGDSSDSCEVHWPFIFLQSASRQDTVFVTVYSILYRQ